ncbi:MAG: DUF4258 domain-containing protein [Alphaproteobacteria bacterium]|nr:DUF4258 domain-containing protein [Alphaproteobacteria bacterium]
MVESVKIIILDHALEAMEERGASVEEVERTVREGDMIPAKIGRMRYMKNLRFDGVWRGRRYTTKQVNAIVARRGSEMRVVTVIVKYIGKEEA